MYVFEDPEVKNTLGINCVLTIMDKYHFNYFQVAENIERQKIEHHKWIDLADGEQYDIYPFLEEAHGYIKDKLNDHNVLVHCQMGISRSSTLVIAYMMKEYGMSFKEARDFVRSKRPEIDPNQGFIDHLINFQHYLEATKVTEPNPKHI